MSTSDVASRHEESFLWTLEEIGRLVSASGNASETLTNIVHLIQQRFGTDVCSVYLLEPDRANLVLAATVGLRLESVGRVRMRLNEGLAGLVAEQVRPQVVADAPSHPRFKYFPEAGEDLYRSFLGVPIVDRGLLQGVLVVQTIEPRVFSTEDTRLLTMAGGQVASIVTEARALGQFVAPAHQRLVALAQNLWWSWDPDTTSLFRELDPVLWRTLNNNPVAMLQQIPVTSSRNGLAARPPQPHQLRLSPAAGVSALAAHVGRAPCRRAVGEAGRVLLGGVRAARVAADLLWRSRHPGRRSHQERLGSRAFRSSASASTTTRATSVSGSIANGWQCEDYIDVDHRQLPIRPALSGGVPVNVAIETRTGTDHRARVGGVGRPQHAVPPRLERRRQSSRKIVS